MKPKNIWLVHTAGPLPSEQWRLGRFAIIGDLLAKNGYEVTWWTANFEHYSKTFRSKHWERKELSPHFDVIFVPTPAYYKHVGLARLWFFVVFGWRFYQRAKDIKDIPNILISVSPAPIIDFFVVRLSKRFKAKILVDIMDLWPEVFLLLSPTVLQKFMSLLFLPLRLLRRYYFNNSHAVTALCQTYLDIAKDESPNLENSPSSVIYNGVESDVFLLDSMRVKDAQELKQKYQKSIRDIWVIYAGSLGVNYDIETLLCAALNLREKRKEIKIFIAGDGPLKKSVVNFVDKHQLDNVVYLGSMDFKNLVVYYSVCDIGLSLYKDRSPVIIPVKVYDYLAAGLPVVNSIKGELEQILLQNDAGINYVSGDASSLESALIHICDDKLHIMQMAKNARALSIFFERKHQYEKYLNIVSSLTENDHSNR